MAIAHAKPVLTVLVVNIAIAVEAAVFVPNLKQKQ
jgi:hypothetical protein